MKKTEKTQQEKTEKTAFWKFFWRKYQWYLLPVVVWLLAGIVYASINLQGLSSHSPKNTNDKTSPAKKLQTDINFISAKADRAAKAANRKKGLLALSKEQVMKEEKTSNFLLRKARRQLERAPFAQEIVTTQYPPEEDTATISTTDSLPHDYAYYDYYSGQSRPPLQLHHTANQDEQHSELDAIVAKYERIEQVRKQMPKAALNEAIAHNRQRNEAIRQPSTLPAEVDAYEKALQKGWVDRQRYHEMITDNANIDAQNPQNPQNPQKPQNPRNTRNTRTGRKPKLSFATKTGTVDHLDLAIEMEDSGLGLGLGLDSDSDSDSDMKRISNVNNSASLPTPSQIPGNHNNLIKNNPKNNPKKYLPAVIDQDWKKIKSGDKIQLRITQSGILPVNTLCYGICSIANSRIFISVQSGQLPTQYYANQPDQQHISLAMEVYDLDGIRGIYIQQSNQQFTNDLLREGLNQAGRIGFQNPVSGSVSDISLRLGRRSARRSNSASIPAGYQVLLLPTN